MNNVNENDDIQIKMIKHFIKITHLKTLKT